MIKSILLSITIILLSGCGNSEHPLPDCTCPNYTFEYKCEEEINSFQSRVYYLETKTPLTPADGDEAYECELVDVYTE